ncbi:hypothetical protein OG429_38645 [Streptomyces sp. NBC_00190]|uniref:hypothetical protein n=1 Tax=unclassified Streptomyces TaxID=2593676 RepID=UPI002E2B28F0|nr:hypothetical protein [Streptomyces sp. NBC_00190]WSZ44661.1 hypothetical protein OG239_41075 [Streptomyces sp. NBC_00868]
MSRMLSLTMNDAAAGILGVLASRVDLTPPGGLAPGLRDRLTEGITRRGQVLTWANSAGNANDAPSFFGDLTGWECADSSFHLEDHVPVDVRIIDDAPQVSQDDQRILLLHGITFALEFRDLITRLDHPSPVRCIVSANETNATFRFHQIRAGESWSHPDLDSYRMDKMVVIDLKPAAG